ncbi:MAG: hypothetical protein WCO07_02575 [bacterium]
MTKIKEKILKMFESKVSVGVLYGIGFALVVMIVFYCGVSVGFHKASFGRAWGDNYQRNFGMMGDEGMMGGRFGFRGDNFPNAHGSTGKIIKVELPTIIVQDKNGTEKVILIKNDTRIQKMMVNIQKTDLKTDDFVVAIGSPNTSGQIEAKFIRVMPRPELLNNLNLNSNEKLPQ